MPAEPLYYTLAVAALAFGAVVGSFLNVVIHRVPAGDSIVRPPSHCPECETPIRWYDNIPIVSWFVLDGRCRHCEAEIPIRYTLVEALMAFLSVALWIKVAGPHLGTVEFAADFPWVAISAAFGLYFVFLALLVAITFVDLEHYLIPHEFTLPGIALGVGAAFVLNSGLLEDGALAGFWPPVTLTTSLIGVVGGALAVIVLFYLYFAVRGVEGLGGGDVTMMALTGAWLGWPALLFVFFAASVQGLVAAALGGLFGARFLKDSGEILAADPPGDDDRPRASDRRRPQDADGDSENDTESSSEPSDQPDEGGSSRPDTADRDESPDEFDDDTADDETTHDDTTHDETADHETSDDQATGQDTAPPESSGGLAIPFGPFIALSGAQYLFIGEFLPPMISLSYLYPPL